MAAITTPTKLPPFDRNFRGVVALANWIKANRLFPVRSELTAANVAEGDINVAFFDAVQRLRPEKPISYYVLTAEDIPGRSESASILLEAEDACCRCRNQSSSCVGA